MKKLIDKIYDKHPIIWQGVVFLAVLAPPILVLVYLIRGISI